MGVGIELGKRPTGEIAVVKVLPGSPAAEGGKVKPADILLSINATKPESAEKAQQMLLGPEVCLCVCVCVLC